MAGRKLVIGIDYTDRYCQACYYSYRHLRPESVSAGTDVMRYLIPSVLFYDSADDTWAVGNSALRMAEDAGEQAVGGLMEKILADERAQIAGREYSYRELLAIFFGKLLEYIQIRTSIMAVESVTVTMNEVDDNIKQIMEEVFGSLGIPASSVRLLSTSESFGYFFINESSLSGSAGAIIFDFGYDGFFVKQLKMGSEYGRPLVFIDEYDFSGDFSISSIASEMLREQMDLKLSNLFLDLKSREPSGAVFFTGEGFSEQWFTRTLNTISGSHRAFKGNNIYVKGACTAGFLQAEGREEDITIICRGRTRVFITARAWDNGAMADILLSPGAVDWYDAGFAGDFILENERSIVLKIHSVISQKTTPVEIVLSSIPERPVKTTRVEIEIKYKNEMECVITVTDKGFGDFFPGSGCVVTRYVNLE